MVIYNKILPSLKNKPKFSAQNYMEVALKMATHAAKKNEVPVGAVIVDKNGNIIAKAHNLSEKSGNPLKHAEMIVLEKALKKVDKEKKHDRLKGFSLFVTLEPCAMCAAAISHSRVSNIYYAASDEKGGAIETGARIYEHKTCLHKPHVFSGILAEKSENLLKKYFKNLRFE